MILEKNNRDPQSFDFCGLSVHRIARCLSILSIKQLGILAKASETRQKNKIVLISVDFPRRIIDRFSQHKTFLSINALGGINVK